MTLLTPTYTSASEYSSSGPPTNFDLIARLVPPGSTRAVSSSPATIATHFAQEWLGTPPTSSLEKPAVIESPTARTVICER
jgi:hypothetical protein